MSEGDNNSSKDTLNATVEPDDYAYIMFTSGSTAVPKGIRVTHRATMSHLSFEPARLHARPGRRHAQVVSKTIRKSLIVIAIAYLEPPEGL
ncbi:hypothetical protein E4U54_001037 [Claviceps lovelessii]|nr:hypothetical protein E4U54_001037 [Claviceps lovelessii]